MSNKFVTVYTVCVSIYIRYFVCVCVCIYIYIYIYIYINKVFCMEFVTDLSTSIYCQKH